MKTYSWRSGMSNCNITLFFDNMTDKSCRNILGYIQYCTRQGIRLAPRRLHTSCSCITTCWFHLPRGSDYDTQHKPECGVTAAAASLPSVIKYESFCGLVVLISFQAPFDAWKQTSSYYEWGGLCATQCRTEEGRGFLNNGPPSSEWK